MREYPPLVSGVLIATRRRPHNDNTQTVRRNRLADHAESPAAPERSVARAHAGAPSRPPTMAAARSARRTEGRTRRGCGSGPGRPERRPRIFNWPGASSTDRPGGKMVGVRGIEPPTPSSRTRCATRLRYTPTRRLYSRASHVAQGASRPCASRPAASRNDPLPPGHARQGCGTKAGIAGSQCRASVPIRPLCGV